MSDLCRVQRTSKNHNQRGILEIVVTLKNPNLLNCLHNTSTQPHQHRCSNHFLEPLFLIGINDSAHNQTARASSRCSTVMNSWRFSFASWKALLSDCSSSLLSMIPALVSCQ